MIVTDTNVLAHCVIPGEHTSAARALLVKDARWAAPLLWRSEFRSVLSLYIRKGLLSLDGAVCHMDQAQAILDGEEYQVNSQTVLRLAAQSGCSAYDCEFVALAMDLGVPLVTLDRAILAGFPKVAVTLVAWRSRRGTP